MGLEDLMCPVVVLEFEDRDVAVGRCASEQAACLVGRPCDEVDRGGVEGDLIYLLPAVGLLAPDEDLAVVRGGSENVAVLGVRPRYAPDSTFVPVNVLTKDPDGHNCWAGLGLLLCAALASYDVPSKCLYQCVLVAFHLKDLDCLVRRASR